MKIISKNVKQIPTTEVVAPQIITMSVDEWIPIKGNCKQRKTEAHLAKSATRNKFNTLRPTHSVVIAARYPDGSLVKVDGHTRALAWSRGVMDRPPFLTVIVHSIRTKSDEKQAYEEQDSSTSVDTAGDRMHGAFRLVGYFPKSGLIKKTGLKTALTKLTSGNLSEDDLVKDWLPEIVQADELMLPSTHFFNSALTAALIRSLRSYSRAGEGTRTKVKQFWINFAHDEGIKQGKKRDGVQHLLEICTQIKSEKIDAKSSADDLLHYSAECLSRYLSGVLFSVKPRKRKSR